MKIGLLWLSNVIFVNSVGHTKHRAFWIDQLNNWLKCLSIYFWCFLTELSYKLNYFELCLYYQVFCMQIGYKKCVLC